MNDVAKEKSERLRVLGRVLLLGPLPVLVAFGLSLLNAIPLDAIRPAPVCAFFGGLWGLALGLKLRRLSRALTGLNFGAILGFATGWVLQNYFSREAAVTIVLPAISLGILRGLIWLQLRKRSLLSFAKGFIVGVYAMIVMAVSFMVIAQPLALTHSEKLCIFVPALVSSALGVSILFRNLPIVQAWE